MGMTITEKILAKHSSKSIVKPGQIIECEVDIVLGNDITAPIAINEFEKLDVKDVFDRDKIVLVPDHFTPNKDIKSAQQVRQMREFARKYNIKHFYETGRAGIEHALLPEQGIVTAGDCVVGADSHTCAYGALGAFSTGVGSTDMAGTMITGKTWFKVPHSMKFIYYGKLNRWVYGKDLILYTIGKIGVEGARYRAMEFTGEVISSLPMEQRLTMCNMAIEAGAKSGIIEPDKITEEYLKNRSKRKPVFYFSDKDSKYIEEVEIDTSKIEPQVSFPHLPENAKNVSEAKGIEINQVFIGSCTNGWLSDLRTASEILKGHKVSPNVRCIVIPSTPEIYKQALKEGLIETFINADAVFSTPTCGPCLGGHMGILAEGERAVSTSNRNFVGRMGHPESEVYLASPAVAAASAITGRITSPEEIF